jgi:hypothetical protein
LGDRGNYHFTLWLAVTVWLDIFSSSCTYCHKVGHREAQCFSKICDQRDAATTELAGGNTPPTSNQLTELSDLLGSLLLKVVRLLLYFHHTVLMWIADTIASCHLTCSDEGMFNCVEINEDIKVGDGNFIKATKMGSKRVSVQQPGGVVKIFTINDCKYVP